MAEIKFAQSTDLPIGSHEPCKLVSVRLNTPDEKLLARYPDMRPSYCFRFELCDPNSQFNGHSAVRFATESTSRLSALFRFLVDMNGGKESDVMDPEQFVGRMFRIKVRKRPKSDRLHVDGTEPLAAKPVAAKPVSPPLSKYEQPAAEPGYHEDVPF